MKTLVITGGSSGIGRAAAEIFAGHGYRVFELSRHGGDLPGITHIGTDISDESSVRAAFKAVSEETEKIDLLICNAGFGISGAIEFTELCDAKRQFDVNLFGAFMTVKYALPLVKKARGRIMFCSSAAAVFSIPFQGFYSASKAALNSLSAALKNELKGFGVSVCSLQFGDTATGFTAARESSTAGNDRYKGAISKSVAVMEKDEKNGMSSKDAAAFVFRISKKKRVRPVYTVGAKYRLFCFANRLLPASLVNFAIGKMYIPK